MATVPESLDIAPVSESLDIAPVPEKLLNGKVVIVAVLCIVLGSLGLAFYDLLSRHITRLQTDNARNYYQLGCLGVISLGVIILAVQLFS